MDSFRGGFSSYLSLSRSTAEPIGNGSATARTTTKALEFDFVVDHSQELNYLPGVSRVRHQPVYRVARNAVLQISAKSGEGGTSERRPQSRPRLGRAG